jgi:hypothetical protein
MNLHFSPHNKLPKRPYFRGSISGYIINPIKNDCVEEYLEFPTSTSPVWREVRNVVGHRRERDLQGSESCDNEADSGEQKGSPRDCTSNGREDAIQGLEKPGFSILLLLLLLLVSLFRQTRSGQGLKHFERRRVILQSSEATLDNGMRVMS